MGERYICIHGHFYQPPRENAGLEAIELQDSAYPYHDWNERITAECYARNAASRILDADGWIEMIVNNYARISFNFGPTLLAWMENNAETVYQAVLDADRDSRERFSGHGSALAQVFNHIIMPLANRRDKETQVRWGIRDFEMRFGRLPEGMWLAETAVDIETLEVLAEQDIRFTILAPYQGARVRTLDSDEEWRDVTGGAIDITMPYVQKLPSGRDITIFFYDGPISRAVAFENILASGEAFAGRIMDGFFTDDREHPQLVHIATDGESYGHHHHHGDMALAYALHYIESNNLATLTNYGEYLEKCPPSFEVEIYENTAWSCAHGIERWRSDCGCQTGGDSNWHQGWRDPLRNALDWLRDILAASFEKKAGPLLRDPWEARNDYIEVIRDRSDTSLDRFFTDHAAIKLGEKDKLTLLKLLEIQRQTLLMYTSCGWFFSELSGIETVQVIEYAGRAIQLAEEFCGETLEPGFLHILQGAHSNIPEHENGRVIYEKFVKPALVDLKKVAAHYAITSIFQNFDEEIRIYCYHIRQDAYRLAEAGRARLVTGVVTVTSEITRESASFGFGALHLGDHNVSCGIRPHQGPEAYQEFSDSLLSAFDIADFPSVIRIIDDNFPAYRFSLTSLFHDEQRAILDTIFTATMEGIEASYRQIYENHTPLIRFLKSSRTPVPKALYIAGEVVVNAELRRAFDSEELDTELIEGFLRNANLSGISLDEQTLEYTLRKTLEQLADQLYLQPGDPELIARLSAAMDLVHILPFTVEIRKIQDICFEVREVEYADQRLRAKRGVREAQEWVDNFTELCNKLTLRLE